MDTAAAFKGTFDYYKNLLMWDATRAANDAYARGTYWTDASRTLPCSGCTAADNTTYGADTPDVAFIHTHGSHTTTASQILMGSAAYGCNIFSNQNILFGNTDLEIAVVKACQSGDYDVWANGGYNGMTSLTGEFSMWNAFHGDSSCGSHVTSYVGSYVASSFYDGAGENWLEEAYDSWGADDCPVSIVWGGTSTDRESQYRYGGWLDRKSTGFKSASTIFYVAGCAPDNGRVLP